MPRQRREKGMRACSFTGHRSIAPSHRDRIIPLTQRAIEYAYSEGCRDFYVGGALGFDTLAAREVIRFRMFHPDARLILLLPCMNQDERWSGSQRSAYEHILSSADEISYIAENYFDGCMRERNLRLAECADMVIAYVGRSRSGAAQTARMAESLGKKVYNLYPTLEEK